MESQRPAIDTLGSERRPQTISVLVAGHREILNGSICFILKKCGDIDVMGSTEDPVDTVAMTVLLHPHVLMIDIRMLAEDVNYVVGQIRARAPRCKIIAWAEDKIDTFQLAALAHVDGYLTFSSSCESLGDAIRTVAAGRSWVDPSISQKVKRIKDSNSPALRSEKLHQRLTQDGWGGNKEVDNYTNWSFPDRAPSSRSETYDGFHLRTATPRATPRRPYRPLPSGGVIFATVLILSLVALWGIAFMREDDANEKTEEIQGQNAMSFFQWQMLTRYQGTPYVRGSGQQ